MKKKTNGKKVAARAAPKKPPSAALGKSRPEPDRLPVKAPRETWRSRVAKATGKTAAKGKPALDVTVKDGVTYTTSPGAVADLTEMVSDLQAGASAAAKRELMLNDEIAKLQAELQLAREREQSVREASAELVKAETVPGYADDQAAQIESLRAELTTVRQDAGTWRERYEAAHKELSQLKANGPPATLDKLAPLADLPAHPQLALDEAPMPPPPPAPPPKKVSRFKKQEPAGEIDADTLEALGLSADNLK